MTYDPPSHADIVGGLAVWAQLAGAVLCTDGPDGFLRTLAFAGLAAAVVLVGGERVRRAGERR